MNKVIIALLSVLVVSGCYDRQELSQQAIKSIRSDVDELKEQVAILGENDTSNTNPSSIYIAPPTYKSKLDAEFASATIDRGIDRITLNSVEGGGTNVTLITSSGRTFGEFRSDRDFSGTFKIFGGHYSERVAFLLDEESAMDDNSAAIKQAILAILQDRG